MKFYKIMLDNENSKGNEVVCYVEKSYQEKYGLRDYDIYTGEAFPNWNTQLTFSYNREQGNIPTDFVASDLGWPIISPNFRKVLDDIGGIGNVEYLPVRIVDEITGEELLGYTVVNVVTLIDALDLSNSLYFHYDSENVGLIKHALKSDKIVGMHFVRLKNHPFSLFVSERVKKELLNSQITGCDFLQVKVT